MYRNNSVPEIDIITIKDISPLTRSGIALALKVTTKDVQHRIKRLIKFGYLERDGVIGTGYLKNAVFRITDAGYIIISRESVIRRVVQYIPGEGIIPNGGQDS